MRILVTGASGFVGQHLLRELSSDSVVGTVYRGDRVALAAQFPNVAFRALDIADGKAVDALVREVQPELCFHLAGVSSVDLFRTHVAESFRINTEGWLHVLEAFKKFAPKATLVLISSAQVYGQVAASQLPITESAPMQPGNFYAVSKGACEWLAKNYGEHFGLRVIILRPFNHVGPGQSTSFVCANLAKQIAEIEAGIAEPVLRAGNTANKRDFTDVRDIVRAYVLAARKCKEGIAYNICSEKAVAISDIQERLLAMAHVKTRIKSETALKRDADPENFYGNCERFRKATGWAPHIPLDKTLEDTLNYWRAQVTSKGVSNRASV